MKKLLLIAALALTTAGCVTPGQQVRRGPNDDPSRACFDALAYDKRFVPLREKIAINLPAHQPTIEMLADKSGPTSDEKQLLGEWAAARDGCLSQGAGFRAAYAPPTYAAWMSNNVTTVKMLVARLYVGEISYGEFNRLRAEASEASRTYAAGMAQRDREQAAAAEERRRQDAGSALQNFQNQLLLQQQIRNQQIQQNTPRQTTCQRFGNRVDCTTY